MIFPEHCLVRPRHVSISLYRHVSCDEWEVHTTPLIHHNFVMSYWLVSHMHIWSKKEEDSCYPHHLSSPFLMHYKATNDNTWFLCFLDWIWRACSCREHPSRCQRLEHTPLQEHRLHTQRAELLDRDVQHDRSRGPSQVASLLHFSSFLTYRLLSHPLHYYPFLFISHLSSPLSSSSLLSFSIHFSPIVSSLILFITILFYSFLTYRLLSYPIHFSPLPLLFPFAFILRPNWLNTMPFMACLTWRHWPCICDAYVMLETWLFQFTTETPLILLVSPLNYPALTLVRMLTRSF